MRNFMKKDKMPGVQAVLSRAARYAIAISLDKGTKKYYHLIDLPHIQKSTSIYAVREDNFRVKFQEWSEEEYFGDFDVTVRNWQGVVNVYKNNKIILSGMKGSYTDNSFRPQKKWREEISPNSLDYIVRRLDKINEKYRPSLDYLWI